MKQPLLCLVLLSYVSLVHIEHQTVLHKIQLGKRQCVYPLHLASVHDEGMGVGVRVKGLAS